MILLAACKRDDPAAEAPRPREVTDASVAQFCGMTLTEHAGPKGQIFVRGLPDPYWFATVRDAFAFTMLPEAPKAISAIYVSDMARAKNWDQPEPGMWVEAHQAYFVIGSRRRSGMDSEEAIPFSDAAAARAFADANGGRVVGFAEMPRDYILATTPGEK
ncbi:MAG: nitrous oxide reductase accessory protein NosL [Xanthobacteraceae bacterium]